MALFALYPWSGTNPEILPSTPGSIVRTVSWGFVLTEPRFTKISKKRLKKTSETKEIDKRVLSLGTKMKKQIKFAERE